MTPFEFDGREVVQFGMASSRVVPGLDPGEDFKPGLGLGLPGAPGDEFAFETGKEALGHGVIVGITHRAHRRAYPHEATASAEGQARVLAAWVGMVNDVHGFA